MPKLFEHEQVGYNGFLGMRPLVWPSLYSWMASYKRMFINTCR